ncbi:hypothetical protein GCM10020331_066270 [Ectobacillus funiculus]
MNRYILDLFSLVVEAATVAHGKQTRKGNGTPYITHPFTVALLFAAGRVFRGNGCCRLAS